MTSSSGETQADSLMSGPRELHRLLSRWADDVLTDDEFQRLDLLLRDSAENRAVYRRYIDLHQALPELVVPAFPDIDHPDELRNAVTQRLRRRLNTSTSRWLVASILVLAVGLFWTGGRRILWPEVDQAVAENGQQAGQASLPQPDKVVGQSSGQAAPAHLAVVTRLDRVTWAADADQFTAGTAVGPVNLRIASGLVELEFSQGACVQIRGPAEFRLLSASRGQLHVGSASAYVPREAQGFTIETDDVEIVDLGTEFSVVVEPKSATDVHVYRGLVEARMAGVEEQPGLIERLGADQTRRYAAGKSQSQALKFDRHRFPAPPERYLDEPSTDGAICLLRQPPKSIAEGSLQSDEFILLFLERKDVLLNRPVPITFDSPGRHDRFRGKSTKLRPPLVVDSYLLHFDSHSVSSLNGRLRLDGSVTFPRPIVGVIAAGQKLAATDPLLGHPDLTEQDVRSRGLDGNTKSGNTDVVTLSEDRRTLHVSFSVGGSCDQLRILTEAAKPR